jgi:hypothetical protein
VGDDEAGAPLHQSHQRLLQLLLRARVDIAGRLVQNQDVGIGQDGARDGQELPLAQTQIAAALGELRSVPLRQPTDKGVGVG